jgi:hypothetical protein
MSEDNRCCGSGTCIINAEGVCWCGQVWDGEKMCMPFSMHEEDVTLTAPPSSNNSSVKSS